MKPKLTWASPHRKGLLGQLHLQLWHLPSFPFLRFPFWILFLQISKICPQCFQRIIEIRFLSRHHNEVMNGNAFPRAKKSSGLDWMMIDFLDRSMVCQKVNLDMREPHDGSELSTKLWNNICCTRMLLFSRGEDARWWVRYLLIGWGAPKGFADPEMIQVTQDAMHPQTK